MSGRGRRGPSRTSAPEAPPERYVEHTLRSEDALMNQPQVELFVKSKGVILIKKSEKFYKPHFPNTVSAVLTA